MTLRRTSHVMHFLMTVATMGLWGIIWAWRARSNARHNDALLESRRRHDDLMAMIVAGQAPKRHG